MNLIYYPNSIFSTVCEKIEVFNQALHDELTQMKEVMYKFNGVALAASQVGLKKRMFVIRNGEIEFINPVIVDTQGSVSISEGCLSAPGIFLPVVRQEAVLLEYQNRDGNLKRMLSEGLEARAILHEMDHLDGIFFFSRVNRERRRAAQSKLKKIIE